MYRMEKHFIRGYKVITETGIPPKSRADRMVAKLDRIDRLKRETLARCDGNPATIQIERDTRGYDEN